jgi:hypothetical protein
MSETTTIVDDQVLESINVCAFRSLKPNVFPCNGSAIELVSLGIATGGASLLFVYILILQVRLSEAL